MEQDPRHSWCSQDWPDVRIRWAASERNDSQPPIHTTYGPGDLHVKLLLQVRTTLPYQVRCKSCLWEALGRAGAVLSWLGLAEDRESLCRCVGRQFRVCRRGPSEPLVSSDLGLFYPPLELWEVELWKPGWSSARAKTLMRDPSILLAKLSRTRGNWSVNKFGNKGPRVRALDAVSRAKGTCG